MLLWGATAAFAVTEDFGSGAQDSILNMGWIVTPGFNACDVSANSATATLLGTTGRALDPATLVPALGFWGKFQKAITGGPSGASGLWIWSFRTQEWMGEPSDDPKITSQRSYVALADAAGNPLIAIYANDPWVSGTSGAWCLDISGFTGSSSSSFWGNPDVFKNGANTSMEVTIDLDNKKIWARAYHPYGGYYDSATLTYTGAPAALFNSFQIVENVGENAYGTGRTTVGLPIDDMSLTKFVQPVEKTISYRGKLSNNGQPVNGTASMKFDLYNAETGGTAVSSGTTGSVTVTNGVFSKGIGPVLTDVLQQNPDLWLQITVNGVPMNQRLKLYAAPYAATSYSAETPGESQPTSWQSHYLKQGDGQGGWNSVKCEYQLLPGVTPFGLVQMENQKLVLMGTQGLGGEERVVISFSTNRGDSWTPFQKVGFLTGRPMELAYLGGNNLTFRADFTRYYSYDGGATWPAGVVVPEITPGGGLFGQEGNPLLDRDGSGTVTAMAEIGYKHQSGSDWDYSIPTDGYIRWSTDQGRTWANDIKPSAWHFNYSYGGSNYPRGTSEGSVVRAANGDVIAALRTDLHPRFYVGGVVGGGWTDGLEGTGFSRSTDNGVTWTPVSILFEAGRQHAALHKLPNGWLVMTMVRRNHMSNGAALPSDYYRGCEALISKDNGVTWNLDRMYILDEFYYYNPANWVEPQCGHDCTVVLDDGRILTAYGKYLQGIGLVRWSP